MTLTLLPIQLPMWNAQDVGISQQKLGPFRLEAPTNPQQSSSDAQNVHKLGENTNYQQIMFPCQPKRLNYDI